MEKGGTSFYRDFDKLPPFARGRILEEATRQLDAAEAAGLKVEWKVSDQTTVAKLKALFLDAGIDIDVTHLPE
jgi:hypothetical protein